MADERDLPPAAVASDFSRFRAFWRDVDDVKAEAVRGTLDVPKARSRLLTLLRTQEADLARSAETSALKAYREAQYVMAATADDAFVRLEWRGAEDWMLHPLETDLFGSRCAGQLVFERIDQLIAGRDPNGRAMAEVYLTALALGFEGQYAGQRDRHDALAAYRGRLRALLAGDRETAPGPLVPQCYSSTMTVGTGRLLRSSRLWWWASAAVVGIWLIVSSLLWNDLRSSSAAEIGQPAVTGTGAAR